MSDIRSTSIDNGWLHKISILRLSYALASHHHFVDEFWDIPLRVRESYSREKSLWWRWKLPCSGAFCYFTAGKESGEFRTELPDNPNVVVKDLPLSMRTGAPSKHLKFLINLEQNQELIQDDAYRGLANIGANVIRLFGDNNNDVINFMFDILNMGSNRDLSGPFIQGNLYNKYFWSMRMSGEKFAPLILIASVQLSSGRFLGRNEIADVGEIFRAYFTDSKQHAGVSDAVIWWGNWYYRRGNEILRDSLNEPSDIAFHTKRYLAYHHFLVAMEATVAARILTITDNLEYTLREADEGAACAGAGIHYSLSDIIDGEPQSFVLAVGEAISKENEQDIDRLFRLSTRPICPYISKPVGCLLIAVMLMLSKKHNLQERGLRMMRDIENTYVNFFDKHFGDDDEDTKTIIKIITGGADWTDLGDKLRYIADTYEVAGYTSDATRCRERMFSSMNSRRLINTIMSDVFKE